ncbi:hypothetical protein Nepgr_005554 [Nepenthes gracilis]|uniref:Uncharacterized protein n=1 Tax=Nepenthes gracilis TaxID=150966 RepID=A0AAD3S3D9_NEPGR|nr:hypothetical protein Nepgr_005554 [Nepenthes gracilis]
MTRRCSHCSSNGHNSRTCPSRGGCGCGATLGAGGGGTGGGPSGGVKLFGVRLTDGSFIKKSASMGNLSLYHSSSSTAASPNPSSPSSDHLRDPVHLPDGYLSDDPNHASCSSNRRSERKKGVPWTEEEHRLFLIGLQKLGKGDWRGIARNYVVSRTPTQVASHAQKHFLRQSNATRRKRRSSLFDMVTDMVTDPQRVTEERTLALLATTEPDASNPLPSLNLSLRTGNEPMEAATSDEPTIEETTTMLSDSLQAVPAYFPAYLPIPYQLWPLTTALAGEENIPDGPHHEVLKPTPILGEAINVNELVSMSHLNLRETESSHAVPPHLSLDLLGTPSRQSAFHARAPVSGSSLSDGAGSAIKAV